MDEHVLRQHGAVDHAGPVGVAQRDEQAAPHPRAVPRVEAVGVGCPHLGQAVEAGGQLGHVAASDRAGRVIAMPEGLDQARRIGLEAPVAVLDELCQGRRLALHQVVAARVTRQLQQRHRGRIAVTDLVECGDIAGREAPAHGVGPPPCHDGPRGGPAPVLAPERRQPGEGPGRLAGAGPARHVGVGETGEPAVPAGGIAVRGTEELAGAACPLDQADRLVQLGHRISSSLDGRSSAGWSRRASPER